MTEEKVAHPWHYNAHPSGVECIEIARKFPFALGCAIKYLWRFRYKGSPVEDLKKAIWYLNDAKKYRSAIRESDEFITARLLVDRFSSQEADKRISDTLKYICTCDFENATRQLEEIISDATKKQEA